MFCAPTILGSTITAHELLSSHQAGMLMKGVGHIGNALFFNFVQVDFNIIIMSLIP